MTLTRKQAKPMTLTRKQALEEARMQKEALRTIGHWRSALYAMTAVFAVLAYAAFQAGSTWFFPGVGAAILGTVSFLLLVIVNLSIRNGNRNVEQILASLKEPETTP